MGSKRKSSTTTLLLSRVRSHAAHHDVSDPQAVADQLRAIYPDYTRLPRNVFVANVQRAIQQYTVAMVPPADPPAAQEEEEQDDGPELEANHQELGGNAMNAAVRQMYQPKPQERRPEETADRRPKRKAPAGPAGEAKRARAASQRPTARYADLGGMDSCLQEVRELIEYPLRHPEIYLHLGVDPPRGILLHGPPGCGKTLLANAVAGEIGVPFLRVSAPELVSGMSGESEKQVRELFESAAASAPAIVFIDEIDAVAPKRETAQKDMERRIVAQMLTCMDDLSLEKTNNQPVLVIGATNRPDALDAALRRAGRFDREISIGIPNGESRARIMKVITSKIRLSGDFDFDQIASMTPGFVGADLSALAKEAAVLAVNRIFAEILPSGPATGQDEPQSAPTALANWQEPFSQEQLAPLSITMADFELAVTKVQPSSKREGFTTVPDVTWSAIGALDAVRAELDMTICQPIRNPDRFKRLGISSPAGVLLYGPPGCGKTLVAKAVANESGANFISVKGPELLNKYVGESERAVRQLFSRAQASAPCIVFFDEMDALCPNRGSDSNQATERVVNQLLTELDGIHTREQVFVVAATNRPELIDSAMKRPGRLDKLLEVGLPDCDGRVSILKAVARKTPITDKVDLAAVAADPRCNGFSGADLAALVREAAICALRAGAEGAVAPEHFESALGVMKASVGRKCAY